MQKTGKNEISKALLTIKALGLCLLASSFFLLFSYFKSSNLEKKVPESFAKKEFKKTEKLWEPMQISAAYLEKNKEMIQYGHALIANTSYYLGPRGKVKVISNGMNCQNCHLKAGSAVWGNNYAGVLATYPKFRARSGTIENIEKRINDCIERSLNGIKLDSSSKEMQAMVAYVNFVGKYVPKDSIPKGTGLWKLKFLSRAADPALGQKQYVEKCVTCHGLNGQGIQNSERYGYLYPPVWGQHSYNTGAGLYRLSRLAGYIKTNMPFGVDYKKPTLSDEEAWDIAAYINSQARPTKDLSKDWPVIKTKPVDHPFGPYADGFSEEQHKYGPFNEIEIARKNKK
jgi:thiosulfate dehydrogenase